MKTRDSAAAARNVRREIEHYLASLDLRLHAAEYGVGFAVVTADGARTILHVIDLVEFAKVNGLLPSRLGPSHGDDRRPRVEAFGYSL